MYHWLISNSHHHILCISYLGRKSRMLDIQLSHHFQCLYIRHNWFPLRQNLIRKQYILQLCMRCTGWDKQYMKFQIAYILKCKHYSLCYWCMWNIPWDKPNIRNNLHQPHHSIMRHTLDKSWDHYRWHNLHHIECMSHHVNKIHLNMIYTFHCQPSSCSPQFSNTVLLSKTYLIS